MNDQFEASIEEAYERGVEAGRADAVPPNTEPLVWCEPHNAEWPKSMRACKMAHGWHYVICRREDPVAHWVTVKEGTT